MYMKMLISESELKNFKSREYIPVECVQCKCLFHLQKRIVQCILAGTYPNCAKGSFCSRTCIYENKTKKVKIPCKQCGSMVSRLLCEAKSSVSGFVFCNRSCSAKYNNAHKKTGLRRSKLEMWIESELTTKYPNLEIHFNKTDTINSELDVYIPSLKLAVELNGIFHYEPIFGESKLVYTQNNDARKFQACLGRGIELCIIDTSGQTYFKQSSSMKYLNIITEIINRKLQS